MSCRRSIPDKPVDTNRGRERDKEINSSTEMKVYEKYSRSSDNLTFLLSVFVKHDNLIIKVTVLAFCLILAHSVLFCFIVVHIVFE